MKSVLHHIEQVRAKPHHIRKGIALFAAMVGTGLIALVWLVGSVSSGVFALQDTSFADQAKSTALTVPPTSDAAALAGAAAGAAGAAGADVGAHIEIVDVASSTHPSKQAEPTTIPF